jgi:hypothetical protein
MTKSKRDKPSVHWGIALASNPALALARPDLPAIIQPSVWRHPRPRQTAPSLHRGLVLVSNPAIVFAHRGFTVPFQPHKFPEESGLVPDRTDMALEASINTLRGLKQLADGIPAVGRPFGATFGVMILVLEAVKVILSTFEISLNNLTRGAKITEMNGGSSPKSCETRISMFVIFWNCMTMILPQMPIHWNKQENTKGK